MAMSDSGSAAASSAAAVAVGEEEERGTMWAVSGTVGAESSSVWTAISYWTAAGRWTGGSGCRKDCSGVIMAAGRGVGASAGGATNEAVDSEAVGEGTGDKALAPDDPEASLDDVGKVAETVTWDEGVGDNGCSAAACSRSAFLRRISSSFLRLSSVRWRISSKLLILYRKTLFSWVT
jgi:hypothetical protein